MMHSDAVIAGAGHKRRAAACYLARAGFDAVVIEENGWFGGAAVSRPLYPGFTYSKCSRVSLLPHPVTLPAALHAGSEETGAKDLAMLKRPYHEARNTACRFLR